MDAENHVLQENIINSTEILHRSESAETVSFNELNCANCGETLHSIIDTDTLENKREDSTESLLIVDDALFLCCYSCRKLFHFGCLYLGQQEADSEIDFLLQIIENNYICADCNNQVHVQA